MSNHVCVQNILCGNCDACFCSQCIREHYIGCKAFFSDTGIKENSITLELKSENENESVTTTDCKGEEEDMPDVTEGV